MKRLIIVALFLVPLAQAKDRPYLEKGVLLSMEAVPCGYEENKGSGVAGELLGADSEHKKTQEMLCQEYVLHCCACPRWTARSENSRSFQ